MIPFVYERADGPDMVINDRFSVPTFVDEGQAVLAPYKNGDNWTGLRCRVTVAAGYHARVECPARSFARWFHIDQLRVENGRPGAMKPETTSRTTGARGAP